jgi:kynurenine formamidase
MTEYRDESEKPGRGHRPGRPSESHIVDGRVAMTDRMLGSITRRRFASGTVAAGAALAVTPVDAPAVRARTLSAGTVATAEEDTAGVSPWGPDDQIGALNLISETSVLDVLRRVSSGKVYDLSVEYYVGMPSFDFYGQPRYQVWNVHTPQGTTVDNPTKLTREQNELVTYSGSAISMYAHTGTHVDALAHFGLRGKIWNGFETKEHLGDRGWRKAGVENYPPMIARGVLIDVAALKGVDVLPESYGITVDDLEAALQRQGTSVTKGDVVMARTGRMKWFGDRNRYMHNTPGLTRESANYLADRGAILIGADNISTDVWPSKEKVNYIPVHSSMLTGRGVPIMQNVYLEELSRDRVHQFAWIGASLKLRGADGAPMRPIALPID